jgi:hypothetical protein
MLRLTCPKCGKADWPGRQEITPPTEWPFVVWHRRTWCRFCGAAQDELRGGGLELMIRHDPIPLGGTNPFLEEDEPSH